MKKVKLASKMKKAIDKIPDFSELLAAYDFGDWLNLL